MKIDVSKIPGFDSLPDDAKTAISGMEFADAPDMTQFVSKAAFDKKASEAADLSKQLKAKLTAEEVAESERKANEDKILEELNQLRREKTVSDYTAKYIALGYDEKLARETATAYADGDNDKVFANQKIHIDSLTKAAKAAQLSGGGSELPSGEKGDGLNYEAQIATAMANNDMAGAAAFIRQQNEMLNNKK